MTIAKTKPIREKYNPRMNVAERRHKVRVQNEPCFACGSYCTQAHHTLLKLAGMRWRRDHRYLLPVCPMCHAQIHDTYGDEAKWLKSINREPWEAEREMERLWAESQSEDWGL